MVLEIQVYIYAYQSFKDHWRVELCTPPLSELKTLHPDHILCLCVLCDSYSKQRFFL